MPSKRDAYASPSQKVLGLYSLLLFSGRKYTLTRLSEILHCSKQTVIRMLEQIERSNGITLESWTENKQRVVRIGKPPQRPNVCLSPEEVRHLVLCKDMVMHLLPKGLCDELQQTLARTTVLLPDFEERAKALDSFSSVRVKGSIDYTPFQETIDTLLKAIEERSVCLINYQAAGRDAPQDYHFAPMGLISFREALYIGGFKVTDKGRPEKLGERTLSIQRIREITLTRRVFDFPMNADEMRQFFGFMRQQPFRVRVMFTPEVAAYVAERVWSEDQTVTMRKDGGVLLEFTAQSRPEVVSWVLSFGRKARVVAPEDLRQEIREEAQAMLDGLAP